MTHAEALSKIAKLLRLATSNNPAESAAAAAKAQEIMERHKLTAGDLSLPVESAEPIENFAHDPIDVKADRWRVYLLSAIAKLNQCKLYLSGPKLCLIGRATDVGGARYIYSWLVREVERLASRDCRGCGRTYWNNYRLGAVETVTKRLRETAAQTLATVREEVRDDSRALVLVNQNAALMVQRVAEVEDWTRTHMKLRAGRRSSASFNPSARSAGQRAGNEVRLGASAGALGSGQFKLN